jgi:predicted alpha/beta-hydrolase family hydrolase
MLFISGTRDTMAEVEMMESTVGSLGRTASLHWIEDADHGFHVRKRSGRTEEDVRREAAEAADNWCREHIASHEGS